jgi:ribose transport system permease protein
LIHTGLPIPLVIVCTLCIGAAVGLFNALAVVVLRIPSLIATLATWLIANSLSVAVSGNRTISSTRVSGDFTRVAQASWGRFPAPVFYVLAITVVLAIAMSHTAGGRYLYAVGYDAQVARLAGLRVKRIQTISFVAAGMIAAFAGVILTARLSSATPNSGDPYLLPAFAAAFLGATQFKAKRFNAVGTIIAVYMLGTGQYGLLLAGVPQWIPNIFQGTALIAAIGVTQLQDSSKPRVRRRRATASASSSPSAVPEGVAAVEPAPLR